MTSLSTSTYYNPFPPSSPQAEQHWANFIDDATIAIYQVAAVGHFIEQSSHKQIRAIDDASRSVSKTMDIGFAAVNGGLMAVAHDIQALGSEQTITNRQLDVTNTELSDANESLHRIDQRLSLLVEEQRITNVLQENIAHLLRIPDSQLQRQLHIEMGLKFFKNARKDSDLYHDALKELLAAEALMPSDYFVLHRVGMLYLYAAPVVDLTKAAEYLSKAGKYAAVESDPEAIRLENVLQKSVHTRFATQADPSTKAISLIAADSYHHAAAAQYALGNFPESVKLIQKAATLEPNADTHRFFKAKYLAAAGQPNQALDALKTLPATTALVNSAMSDLDLLKGPALEWTKTFAAEKKRLLIEIAPVADVLKEAMAKDAALARVLVKSKAAQRVLSLTEADTKSVMELADIEGAFSDDRSSLENADFLIEYTEKKTIEFVERVPTGKVEKVPTGEFEMVPTGERETYYEEVIVKPAGFFRKAVVEIVRRTRPLFVERPVYREEPVLRDERRKKMIPGVGGLAIVNGFGRLKASFPGCWVDIPAGTFRKGGREYAEEVSITRPFKMFSVPMPQVLYKHLMGKNPSNFKGDARPVENVSWLDAVKCCNALSTVLGLSHAYRISGEEVEWEGLSHPGVRLPTEAEWEYACRAGTTGAYPGNQEDMA